MLVFPLSSKSPHLTAIRCPSGEGAHGNLPSIVVNREHSTPKGPNGVSHMMSFIDSNGESTPRPIPNPAFYYYCELY